MSAAKKNRKRAENRAQQRAQKLKDDGVIDRLKQENDDPVANLKAQLQEAKTNKDHKLAAKLRKDIWVMQDQLAGQLPPGENLEPSEITDEVVATETKNNTDENPAQQIEKRVRKLKKKLQQIDNLKSKQEGEELDSTQLAKIQCEEAVLQEINELEELLKQEVTSI